MNTRLRLSVLGAFLVLASITVPVFAAQPLDVHIEVRETFAPDEPFWTSGPATDTGMVCASGTVNDESVTIVNPSGPAIRILDVLKRFTCGDGSGTFDVRLLVRLDLATHETTATWQVQGGTGDYSSLSGGGKLTGTPIEPGVSILDVYDGMLH